MRLPGGHLSPAQLEVLSDLAGPEDLELTSRGNIQLRGVADLDLARERLAEVGLLPSATHERVRNILASPLARDIDAADALDAGLRDRPALANLPGRFLFAIDDGTHDVASLAADVESRADTLYLSGYRTDLPGTVDTMLAAAEVFVAIRDDEWRISDLSNGPRSISTALGGTVEQERDIPGPPARLPVGWFDRLDGTVALGAGVALGRLPTRTARFLAAVDRPITITPWRTVLLRDLDEDRAEAAARVLAPMGLIFDADSPWLRVSACVGNHGCARAKADSLGHAARLAPDINTDDRVHVVACEHGCGAPVGEHLLVIAPTGQER